MNCCTPMCPATFDGPAWNDYHNHACQVFCPVHRVLHQAAALGDKSQYWMDIERFRRAAEWNVAAEVLLKKGIEIEYATA